MGLIILKDPFCLVKQIHIPGNCTQMIIVLPNGGMIRVYNHLQYQQHMSDFVVDDWESLIDKDVTELKAVNDVIPPPPKQPQIPIPKQTETKPKPKKEKVTEQTPIQQPKAEKPKPLTNEEKRKAQLLSKLANESLIDDLFDGLSLQNKKASSAQIILKNEKSFEDYAKTVSQRFDEDTTPSEFLEDFCIELLVATFPGFQSNELREIQEKLTVLKNEKKKEDKKKKKEVKKEQKVEETEPGTGREAEVKKEEPVPEEKDLRYVPGMEDFM